MEFCVVITWKSKYESKMIGNFELVFVEIQNMSQKQMEFCVVLSRNSKHESKVIGNLRNRMTILLGLVSWLLTILPNCWNSALSRILHFEFRAHIWFMCLFDLFDLVFATFLFRPLWAFRAHVLIKNGGMISHAAIFYYYNSWITGSFAFTVRSSMMSGSGSISTP